MIIDELWNHQKLAALDTFGRTANTAEAEEFRQRIARLTPDEIIARDQALDEGRAPVAHGPPPGWHRVRTWSALGGWRVAWVPVWYVRSPSSNAATAIASGLHPGSGFPVQRHDGQGCRNCVHRAVHRAQEVCAIRENRGWLHGLSRYWPACAKWQGQP